MGVGGIAVLAGGGALGAVDGVAATTGATVLAPGVADAVDLHPATASRLRMSRLNGSRPALNVTEILSCFKMAIQCVFDLS